MNYFFPIFVLLFGSLISAQDQYDIDDNSVECHLQTPVAEFRASKYSLLNQSAEERPFTACVALGIPYSAPKAGVGSPYRFSLVPDLEWLESQDARHFGPRCVPVKTKDTMPHNLVAEDCLYLNAFIPLSEWKPRSGFPMVFIIHGGGYGDGSAEDFETRGILRNLVKHGIVVITVNYRLGPFGFFVGTDNETINAGLYDLLKAYSFVYNIADSIKGNRFKITILGVDSGAVLAQMMALYEFPGYFHPQGVIAIGGSVSMPWAISPNVAAASNDLMRSISDRIPINHEYKEQLMPYMRCAPLSEFKNVTRADITTDKYRRDFIRFAPTFDSNMFNAPDLGTAMKRSRKFPIYFIASRHDGVMRTADFENHRYAAYSIGTQIPHLKKENFSCTWFKKLIEGIFSDKYISAEVIFEYRCEKFFGYAVYEEFMSDFFYVMPMIVDAMLYAKYDHRVTMNFLDIIHNTLNASHAMPYVPSNFLAETIFFMQNSPHITFTEEIHYYQIAVAWPMESVRHFIYEAHTEFVTLPMHAYKNFSVFGNHFEFFAENAEITNRFHHNEFWRRMIETHGLSIFTENLKPIDDEFKH